ncbi:MAG: transcriptional repressor LexA [Clostridia bacterium]|nr:transcriptional repressor LexA [Clostridia bacterium]
MKTLNNTQKRVYDYLVKALDEDGVPPSIREIGAAVGLKSTSSVQSNLIALEEAGYIERNPMHKRHIRLKNRPSAAPVVPLVGTVTAGMPITAVEMIEDYIPLFGGEADEADNMFALRIRGDSMIDAGILNGDIVVVEKTQYAENGEIVVAMIDDEATVKRFYKENGHYRLQPENDAYEPIIVPEVAIIGKVVSLLRSYR